jgi:hypothetical protein
MSLDEPFSLETGDRLASDHTDYTCIFHRDDGKPDEVNDLTLALIEHDGKIQYATFHPATGRKGEPVTFHRVKEGLYILVVSLRDDDAAISNINEIFSLAQFSDTKLTLFIPSKETDERMQSLATKYDMTVAKRTDAITPIWELGGPLANQRAAVLDLASDLNGWQDVADCTKKTWYSTRLGVARISAAAFVYLKPGETLSAAQFSDSKFTPFSYFGDDRMPSLARHYDVTATKTGSENPIWVFAGDPANQRALILDLASDLTGWKKVLDCAKQVRW